jgi:hypothetical protein
MIAPFFWLSLGSHNPYISVLLGNGMERFKRQLTIARLSACTNWWWATLSEGRVNRGGGFSSTRMNATIGAANLHGSGEVTAEIGVVDSAP